MPHKTHNHRQIAIVFPSEFLGSIPTLCNMITMYAEQDYQVDVFVLGSHAIQHADVHFSSPNVQIHVLPHKCNWPRILRVFPPMLVFMIWMCKLAYRKRFMYIIGVDPNGLLAASVLGSLYRRPWAYLSFELSISGDPLLIYNKVGYKSIERWASRRALTVIIQDEKRAELLSGDNHIPLDHFSYAPNSPMGSPVTEPSGVLHQKFGIGAAEKILLHAGSVGDWVFSRELARLAGEFPNGWHLVFQIRATYNGVGFRLTQQVLDALKRAGVPEHIVDKLTASEKFFSEWGLLKAITSRIGLENTARYKKLILQYAGYTPQQYFGDAILQLPNVHIADHPVPFSDLGKLVRSADIGLALYGCLESPNQFYMGKASGKVCQYLHCGRPVIMTRLPGWEQALEFYHSGISVNAVAEVPEAATKIFMDYEGYCHGVREHFQQELRFEPAFHALVSRLENVA